MKRERKNAGTWRHARWERQLLMLAVWMLVSACGVEDYGGEVDGGAAYGTDDEAAFDLAAAPFAGDVTCGGRFPTASPPYAQAPDGCSSVSNNPQQVRDKWGSADFRPTCNAHDQCYYTLGTNVAGCNQAFCAGLERACRNAYTAKVGGVRIPSPLYPTCLGIAATYCSVVVAAQGVVYPAAQRAQSDWEQCWQATPPPPPPPPETGNSCGSRPHGATWTVRDCSFNGGGEVIVSYRCDDGASIVTERRQTGQRCT